MSFTPTYIKAVTTNYFGHDVGIIAEALCSGPKPLPALFQKISPFLKNKKLFRQQLTLLYWNHIVKCERNSNNGAEIYSISFEHVFRFAMLPSILPVLEELAGPGALFLAKAMIKAGRISFSDIVRQAKADSKKDGEEYD
uniref:DNA-directed RNA polymerase III subunit RPC3 n=1 Tax=Panagrolaimus sp. PS1159 TaxID=55785 RepID=A0AC35FPU6_9BILA